MKKLRNKEVKNNSKNYLENSDKLGLTLNRNSDIIKSSKGSEVNKMKVYRVYGDCADWECHCIRTLKTFSDEDKAMEYANSMSLKEVACKCNFCNANYRKSVSIDIEELEVE